MTHWANRFLVKGSALCWYQRAIWDAHPLLAVDGTSMFISSYQVLKYHLYDMEKQL